MRRTARSVIGILLGVMIGAPLVIWGFLFLRQDSMVFFPSALPPGRAEAVRIYYPRAEELSITASDGVTLRGWLHRAAPGAAGPSGAPLIVYFGGNAEEASDFLPDAASRLGGWSVALVNYRGYGLSEGKPGEARLHEDALSVYDHLVSMKDIDPGMVVAIGRSLGTGVAVRLASRRPVRALVLVSPFDSLLSVARRHYPHVPVSLILRHRFDCISLAPGIKSPVLAIVASSDRIIPAEHSYRLVRAWGGPTRVSEFGGTGHNGLLSTDEHWRPVIEFLDGLKKVPARQPEDG